ncbi:MAG: type I DNA topoisomerase [Bacteroidota bacterium]
MSKSLFIVESPAKAKTIGKYLGDDFIVTSSYGHVRDLPESKLSIDIKNNYEPMYVVSEDKEKIVAELKRLAKKSKEIYFATDEDREGEAISWHLCKILDIDPKEAKRVTYTEITKTAIQKAIANPRKLNLNLVDAQQARRVLDRIVGYEVSPILWKKVKPSLSAGRVQSVATKLIVEREREINSFLSTSTFKILAKFPVADGKGTTAMLKAERKQATPTVENAKSFLDSCVGANYSIKNIEKKPGKRTPSAPFTTSTLQQEASRKLGFSLVKTMLVAQKLYEQGHITYMRTDSTNLSQDAMDASAQEISSRYGKNYLHSRNYTNKAKGAQEAHEAIRPTLFNVTEIDVEYDQQRLYDLIWKRTVASQMAQAETEKTIATIEISTNKDILQASGEVIIFDGFLKVYNESTDEEEDEDSSGLLPPLHIGQDLTLDEMFAAEKYSRPPARYSEAALVKKLEELGIGRPSTYAPTISTIQNRGYALKGIKTGKERTVRQFLLKKDKVTQTDTKEIFGADKNKLFPSDIGIMVTDFLQENFNQIMDYSFTANVEQEFDDIANGDIKWSKMIDDFYVPFHKNVEHTAENSERANKERVLGNHPENGEVVLARIGRYGPMVQMGQQVEDGPKPRYAKMKQDQSIETITLEEALDLFKLPKKFGEYEGYELSANIGRFGPYVMHNKVFASIPKDMDVYELTREQAIEVLVNKKEADAKKLIKSFEKEGIDILNGRYGPYIKKDKENYKIPKDKDPEKLTIEEIQALIVEQDAQPKKGGRGRFQKRTAAAPTKAAAKKTPAKKAASKKAAPKKAAAAKKKAVAKK